MNRFVLGILAHVDSGKTTLSEALLYKTGEIRKIGRVDHQNAFLDTHKIEKERGITIFSHQATMTFKNCYVTLLDTPGHVDFSAEMERTLSVLDYAILVISGLDGIQNHTQTLWKLLKHYNIPTFIFVNKMDISQKTKEELLYNIKHKLSENCFDFTDDKFNTEFYENIAVLNDEMMEEFLNNDIISLDKIKNAVKRCEIFPCIFGSALKLEGVEKLINILDSYMIKNQKKDDFGARVFKITEDEQGVRLTHLKVTGGSLKVKTLLDVKDKNGEKASEKVNQIRIYSGSKFITVDEAKAGSVCAVSGLSKTFSGQGLGFETDYDDYISEPVLNYRVDILDNTDVYTVLEKFRQLQEEEVTLNISWNEFLQEIHISLMGEIQLEVLKQLFYERYNIKIDFGQGNIVYRETIENTVEGVGHYEPLRHYAEVHLILQPLERGSGVVFESNCSEDILEKNWQRLILTHLKEKAHIGVLTGSPITDIKIILATGKAHLKHTEGGDFRQATYRAVRHGLKRARSILLEPFYSFHIEVPMEFVGKVMTDVSNMGGEIEPPQTFGELSVVKGTAPVSEMRDYNKKLIAFTRGKGRINCNLKGYYRCHNEDEVINNINYQFENDIQNTADSVFCAHGSGFTVKWDEVEEYMHLESVLKVKDEDDFSVKITQNKVRSYVDSLEEDKELMKIFERTYGPIKRNLNYAMHTKKEIHEKKENPVKYKASPLKKDGSYLLVDGYNIIFAVDDLKELGKENLDLARNKLITLLCNYRAFTESEIIVVFDAYKVKNNPGEVEKAGNINVVYTKEAETADRYIEKVSKELSKNYFVRVATSDSLEQLIIFGSGAYRISAEAFYKDVLSVEKTISDYFNNQ